MTAHCIQRDPAERRFEFAKSIIIDGFYDDQGNKLGWKAALDYMRQDPHTNGKWVDQVEADIKYIFEQLNKNLGI